MIDALAVQPVRKSQANSIDGYEYDNDRPEKIAYFGLIHFSFLMCL